ncbi:hypothetical protein F5X68DRAFT_37465 [Plectosphaerella plurivora]|uniref:Uncharacterized protein n=1 Tax=Plectosphaerella plurivora TaxID=936078 RepID=A0A9P9A7L0_9PEZI|nr:hypothetical protein F5X68DRAFT_37465 [Plectosphaerella plurivora]
MARVVCQPHNSKVWAETRLTFVHATPGRHLSLTNDISNLTCRPAWNRGSNYPFSMAESDPWETSTTIRSKYFEGHGFFGPPVNRNHIPILRLLAGTQAITSPPFGREPRLPGSDEVPPPPPPPPNCQDPSRRGISIQLHRQLRRILREHGSTALNARVVRPILSLPLSPTGATSHSTLQTFPLEVHTTHHHSASPNDNDTG